MTRKLAAVFAIGMVLAACDTEPKPVDPNAKLTKHQQDSVLAQSKVPGAKPVGAALSTADSQSAKASQFDALQDTLH